MSQKTKKSASAPAWQLEEAAALKKLFEERTELTQEEFGAKFEIGSQGMIWQYLNGHRPLNIGAATGFAIGLGAAISDFCPRLAAEVERAYRVAVSSSTPAPSSANGDHCSPSAAALIEAIAEADRQGVAPAVLEAATALVRALISTDTTRGSQPTAATQPSDKSRTIDEDLPHTEQTDRPQEQHKPSRRRASF